LWNCSAPTLKIKHRNTKKKISKKIEKEKANDDDGEFNDVNFEEEELEQLVNFSYPKLILVNFFSSTLSSHFFCQNLI
jgi:hypothetical protein